ncbi:hypothetical protein VF_A1131 [Aliivibrio fischeri ES114]|uniref:Uncharacterized protein n=4 Tax=Aliivibrio fischeri TaxID=668 RepID=Q5DYE5_ALIF1|nr:hypothetical protein VF_A1131 [Aliivibrio fischeri ES114]KLU80676.1 hypothetical protein AB192_02295 [Aliivibrio fischeri]MUH95654.1 hypothetical protein [Aliivibrio fischeri]MUI55939.1 hypothetical protein [Aliivibrio fischeri]MUI64345.1 hypothetical protein [Aliivibrio fischeri]
MRSMDIRELIIYDIKKRLWFLLNSEVLTPDKKSNMDISLSEIENVDNLDIDTLFLLRNKLIELTQGFSTEQISSEYNMALIESKKMLTLFLTLFWFLLFSFLLVSVCFYYFEYMPIENSFIKFIYQHYNDDVILKSFINLYSIALMSVILRVVFLLSGDIFDLNTAMRKKNRFIIYFIIWPPIVVGLSKITSSQHLLNVNAPDYFVCIIFGWGVETFIKMTERIIFVFEIKISKKISNLIKDVSQK